MCQAIGKLAIYLERPDGYMKGAILDDSCHKHGWYIPSKGGAKMRLQARNRVGDEVTAELVRGMLVRIEAGWREPR